MTRPGLPAFAALLAAAACTGGGGGNDGGDGATIEPPNWNGCSDTDCSGHGTCPSGGDSAACVCETGYEVWPPFEPPAGASSMFCQREFPTGVGFVLGEGELPSAAESDVLRRIGAVVLAVRFPLAGGAALPDGFEIVGRIRMDDWTMTREQYLRSLRDAMGLWHDRVKIWVLDDVLGDPGRPPGCDDNDCEFARRAERAGFLWDAFRSAKGLCPDCWVGPSLSDPPAGSEGILLRDVQAIATDARPTVCAFAGIVEIRQSGDDPDPADLFADSPNPWTGTARCSGVIHSLITFRAPTRWAGAPDAAVKEVQLDTLANLGSWPPDAATVLWDLPVLAADRGTPSLADAGGTLTPLGEALRRMAGALKGRGLTGRDQELLLLENGGPWDYTRISLSRTPTVAFTLPPSILCMDGFGNDCPPIDSSTGTPVFGTDEAASPPPYYVGGGNRLSWGAPDPFLATPPLPADVRSSVRPPSLDVELGADRVTAQATAWATVLPNGPGGVPWIDGDAEAMWAGPSTAAWGDFDGDGLLDLLTLHPGGSGHQVCINDGSGEFRDCVGQTPLAYGSIVPFDIDGDGRDDFAALGTTSAYAFYRADLATAAASELITELALDSAYCGPCDPPLVDDVDGDGRLDVLTRNPAGDILVFRDVASLPSAAEALACLPLAGTEDRFVPWSEYVGDLDADGADEMVCQSLEDGTVRLVPLVSPGSETRLFPATWPEMARIIRLDNGDRPWLALQDDLGAPVRLLRFDDTLAPVETRLWDAGAGLYFGDLDITGDGASEIFFGAEVRRNDGRGVLDPEPPSMLEIGVLSPEIRTADMDGDGGEDLVLSSVDPDSSLLQIGWKRDDGDSYAPLAPLVSRPDSLGLFWTVGRFGGGDALDVAILDSGTQRVEITIDLGASSVTLTPPVGTTLPGPYDAWLAAGELEEDGLDDLVMTGPSWSSLVVVLSADAGAGPAWEFRTIPAAPGGDPQVFDFDGDGHRDVVLASRTGVLVEPGDGTGGFGVERAYAPAGGGDFQPAMACADAGADGSWECARVDSAFSIRVLRIDPLDPVVGVVETAGSTHGNELVGWVLAELNGDPVLELLACHGGGTVVAAVATSPPATLIAEYDGLCLGPLTDLDDDGRVSLHSRGPSSGWLAVYEPRRP